MAQFMQVVMHQGPFTAEAFAAPAPDPAMFGMPAEDDGNRNDLLLGQNIMWLTSYEPDFDALRAASTRIVIAVGAESDGELAHRGGDEPSPSGSAARPHASRATTAASSAASTARPASRTRSPRSCARCWSKPDGRRGGARYPAAIRL